MAETEDSYLSIEGQVRATFRDKASRFIGLAYPCDSEQAVRLILENVRKEYHDANHHCYAYSLGKGNLKWRYNDDGEPAGSAGKPIYGQILSFQVTDVLIIVVRYFGGTKLGIPGLINAYRTTARAALQEACIVPKILTAEIQIEFTFERMNQVMRILKECEARIHMQTYDQSWVIRFSVRRSLLDKVLVKVREYIKLYNLIDNSVQGTQLV